MGKIMTEVIVRYLQKYWKLRKSFQYFIVLVFDKLSHSKLSDLLHIGWLSNSYFETLVD